MSLDLILRIGTKLILPFILLFALYVQFHGDYGPGGGFQAGVIAAGTVILLSITFGLSTARRIAPQNLVERMIPAGVLTAASSRVALEDWSGPPRSRGGRGPLIWACPEKERRPIRSTLPSAGR